MKIYKINNDKFKSIYISYNFTMELGNTKALSNNAVLASLMAKTSKKYESQKQIEQYLNLLYGANYDVNIEKYGDLYNLEFRIEFINKKFLPNKEELLNNILEFLYEMIYNPTDWSEANIEREKEFILERINERKDEKLRYGIQKAEELMCKDTPFGTYLYGEENVVKEINKEILKQTYQELIKSCVTIIVSGNLTEYDDIDKKIIDVFGKQDISKKTLAELNYNIKNNYDGKAEEVIEYQDTVQSVLSIGLSVENCNPNDFYALNLYNAILGTTPSSKLFQNVREKASLAYTVRSRFYRFKDIIIIYAGINKDDYKKATELIINQIDDIKEGKITQEEFTSAKDSLMADLLDWKDSKIAMTKMKLSNIISFNDDYLEVDKMREKMSKVTLQDIINVANKISVRKIFVLGGVVNE